ncbi:MAG: hypothetical protein AAF928_21540 [Myxococcota bacterium]
MAALTCSGWLVGCGDDASPDDGSGGGGAADTTTTQASSAATGGGGGAGGGGLDCGRSDTDRLIVCDGVCVDTGRDVNHCGGCGRRCEEEPNATAECVGFIPPSPACSYTCNEGFRFDTFAGDCVPE